MSLAAAFLTVTRHRLEARIQSAPKELTFDRILLGSHAALQKQASKRRHNGQLDCSHLLHGMSSRINFRSQSKVCQLDVPTATGVRIACKFSSRAEVERVQLRAINAQLQMPVPMDGHMRVVHPFTMIEAILL